MEKPEVFLDMFKKAQTGLHDQVAAVKEDASNAKKEVNALMELIASQEVKSTLLAQLVLNNANGLEALSSALLKIVESLEIEIARSHLLDAIIFSDSTISSGSVLAALPEGLIKKRFVERWQELQVMTTNAVTKTLEAKTLEELKQLMDQYSREFVVKITPSNSNRLS